MSGAPYSPVPGAWPWCLVHHTALYLVPGAWCLVPGGWCTIQLCCRYEWANFGHLQARNLAAGVTPAIIDAAVAAFILEVRGMVVVRCMVVVQCMVVVWCSAWCLVQVVARHGEPADIICAKEPFMVTQAGYLATAFPGAKVLVVVVVVVVVVIVRLF